MAQVGEAKVSGRRQAELPAQVQHRWDLDDGRVGGLARLGDAVLVIPGGVEELRRELSLGELGRGLPANQTPSSSTDSN